MQKIAFFLPLVMGLVACSSTEPQQPKIQDEFDLPVGVIQPVAGSGATLESWKSEIETAPMPSSMTK